MAIYKVWLTVKDRYGSIKEIEGGNITVGLDTLTDDEKTLFDNSFATDDEVIAAIQADSDKMRYSSFELKED